MTIAPRAPGVSLAFPTLPQARRRPSHFPPSPLHITASATTLCHIMYDNLIAVPLLLPFNRSSFQLSAPFRPVPRQPYFPSNSSACASALFAVRSPSIRANSLTRAFRLAWIGSIVTTARSFDWSFVTTR